MPTIMSAGDLRHDGEVQREVVPGKPVFPTQSGRGRSAGADIDDSDRAGAPQALVAELDRGRMSATAGTRSLAEARARLSKLVSDAKA